MADILSETSMRSFLFTSESVAKGHPDKIADQISDAMLDAALCDNTNVKVACETLIKSDMVVIAGEMSSNPLNNRRMKDLVRQTLNDIGYVNPDLGFDVKNFELISRIDTQSEDIRRGVDLDEHEIGAGDQGLMFGYACDETPEFMPLPIMLSNRMMRQLATIKDRANLPWLRPDGKCQVTVEYVNDRPVRIDTIVMSVQHDEDVSLKTVRNALIKYIINPSVDPELLDNVRIHINPTGRFVIGGPRGDCGLTGRKIIVDTYGGMGRHGGGAFSGKDPTKVDRSASYMARYMAKNIVATGLAQKCEIQLAYAIGQSQPVSIMVNTFGTSMITDQIWGDIVKQTFDSSPRAIIEHLDLRTPIYEKTAFGGHFGRDDVPWEKVDKRDDLIAQIRKTGAMTHHV